MVDFTLPPQIHDLRQRVAAFMDEHIYPNEEQLLAEDDEAEALMRDTQQRVKQQGLWAMFIGPEAGGSGSGFLPYAYVNEILGLRMVSVHNSHLFLRVMADVRARLADGTFGEFRREFIANYTPSRKVLQSRASLRER